MLLPGGLTVYLAFNAGGFFPGTPALVAVVLALLVTARLAVARNPLEGLSPLLGVAIAAIALYAVWTLASAFWSDAPARALIEFDRHCFTSWRSCSSAAFGVRAVHCACSRGAWRARLSGFLRSRCSRGCFRICGPWT